MYGNSVLRFCILACILGSPVTAYCADVQLVANVGFENGDFPEGWEFGSQHGGTGTIVLDPSGEVPGSTKGYRATYPVASGGVYTWLVLNIGSYQTRDVAIDFWAKMPSDVKHGLKFLKVFGKSSPEGGYANATLGLDFTGIDNGSMFNVGYGDGTELSNDAQNIIRFDGSTREYYGRSFGTATVDTPQMKPFASSDWGTSWHHFKFRVKFNSGTSTANEIADGEFFVSIDDKIYVDAKNIFNRNPANDNIRSVEFGGWSQSGEAPFEVWYDSIVVTINGFYDQPQIPLNVTKAIE